MWQKKWQICVQIIPDHKKSEKVTKIGAQKVIPETVYL